MVSFCEYRPGRTERDRTGEGAVEERLGRQSFLGLRSITPGFVFVAVFVVGVLVVGKRCLGFRAVGSAFGGRLHAEVDRRWSLLAVGPSGVCFYVW
jgi:hypothetical protein